MLGVRPCDNCAMMLWFQRGVGLAGTEMERAQCHTIREKLFKIAALVRVSVRQVLVLLASGYPYERIFQTVHRNIRGLCPLRC